MIDREKTYWVTDTKTSKLWDYLAERKQSGDFTTSPAEMFEFINESRNALDAWLADERPLGFFGAFEEITLFVPREEKYFLLYHLAQSLLPKEQPIVFSDPYQRPWITWTETEKLLLLEIEKQRRKLEEAGIKQLLKINLPEKAAPATPPTSTEKVPSPEPLAVANGLTENQLSLVVYFTLTHFGVDLSKTGSNKTKAAQFCHLLTGKTWTKNSNSDLYKRITKAPQGKEVQDKTQHLKDLGKVKDLFEQFGLSEISQKVQESTKQIENDLAKW